MLKTETNTPAMEKRILQAASALRHRKRRLVADFEHGQWWITDLNSGAQWSVCDDNSPKGFCFERVTEGDED
jgi:hypothetical protein